MSACAPRRLLLWGLVLSSAVTAVRPSLAEDPSTADCVAASAEWINLRKEQRLREARTRLITCAAPSCPVEVREECSRHLPELNAAIPRIVFVAQDVGGNDLTAVAVTMDGQSLADKLDGRAIAVDPGEHTFRFETAGLPSLEKRLVIYEGDKERREAIEIGVKAELPAAPALPSGSPLDTAQGPSPVTQEATRPTTATGSGLRGQKLLGVVIGGLGAAGLAAGSVAGLMAWSGWLSAQNDCHKGQPCPADSPAQAKKTDASTAATVSDVCFIAGGALLAGGAALFLTARSASSTGSLWQVAPAVGSGGGGVLLRGKF